MKVWEALWPLFMVGVLKLPSSAVALCGAWPVLRQVTVSPTATVTEVGREEEVAHRHARRGGLVSLGADAAAASAEGAAAG